MPDKRVTPLNRNPSIKPIMLVRMKHAYYCDGCLQLRQAGRRAIEIRNNLNPCVDARYCGRCQRRLLDALKEKR
jgi:hypothetical protein